MFKKIALIGRFLYNPHHRNCLAGELKADSWIPP
ncbi:hypothetical protein SPLC1_S240260 [Arthrospira platensis C1]|nr:hypothetical protein SPLC1_S240260 [Arthrospira platensis C1]